MTFDISRQKTCVILVTIFLICLLIENMLTPRFNLSQDEKTLIIKIRAPYCSLRELEVEVDNEMFLFLCKPYYLRLHLPGDILENDNTKSCFDSDSGEFTFSYDKKIHGEHFPDLELITKFLVKKVDAGYEEGNKITVLANQTDEAVNINKLEGFGFALQSNKNFIMNSEFKDIFEIDPHIPLLERRKFRLQFEQDKFNVGHYLGDFFDEEEIDEIIKRDGPWCTLTESEIIFSHKELDFLKELPNIEYNLDEEQIKYVFNGLIDILFAYCYDQRTTNFEGNSESGWTIIKLAATLSWLDAFESPREVIVSAFRRSLTYPLYRNYNLNVTVFEDLKKILKLKTHYIIKCFINIYYVFLDGDCCRYILNNLFIKDYIIYMINWDNLKWRDYIEEIMNIEINKEDLGLNLSDLEQNFSLEYKLAKLNIKDSDSDDYISSKEDSDDSSTDDSDSDSSDSDTSDTDSNFTNKQILKFLC